MTSSQQIILIHDRYAYFNSFERALKKHGFLVASFSYGEAFLDAWENSRRKLVESTGLIIHKDLGQNGGAVGGTTCEDVLSVVRSDDDGVTFRIVLCSGEYSYRGVRDESINRYRADGGYDPTHTESGRAELVPDWVAEYLRLGIVTHFEAEAFRGKSLVENRLDVRQRQAWIEGGFRHKEY